MVGKAGLKAGLICGAIAVILALTTLIPALTCISLPLMFVVYAVAGGLAAYWLPKPRTAGDGAAAGAVAGAVSGAIGGIAWMIVTIVFWSQFGGAESTIQNLPPETSGWLGQYELDPASLFSGDLVKFVSAGCCAFTVVAATALGALVGAIFGAVTKDRSTPEGGEIVQG